MVEITKKIGYVDLLAKKDEQNRFAEIENGQQKEREE